MSADSNTLDVVAQVVDGEYVIVMVEDRPWNTDPAQPTQLREKIKAYAGFILNGDLACHHPKTAGQPLLVQLDWIGYLLCTEMSSTQVQVLFHAALED